MSLLSFSSGDFWRENAGGGWATLAVVLILLTWQLLRLILRRRLALAGDPNPILDASDNSIGSSSYGIKKLITESDLEDLITSLDGKLNEEKWENVIDKKNNLISYNAKCCRPKDGPLKYLSITTFEKCSTELLRDFYMDNEYRKEWDKTLISHEQLQADESSGIEVGRTIKKFPFLTPREYVLAWSTWEGQDKTFYCVVKDCKHPLAPQGNKYVRVGFYRSGWRIRKVIGRDACEITMVHREDAGLNIEMAKLAFSKGIWNYVCKMNSALRDYSPLRRSKSLSVLTLLRLIKKVPPEFESHTESSQQTLPESSERDFGGQQIMNVPENKALTKSAKIVANGLLILGGIVCLSRASSTLGTQLAMACILRKLMKQGTDPNQVRAPQVARVRHDRRHIF